MRNPWERRLIGAATLAALVMHLLAGCCGHHSHAACVAGLVHQQSTASATQRHAGAQPCHGDHAPSGPEQKRGCDAGRCVFVAPDEGGAAKLVACAFFALPATNVAPADPVQRGSDVAGPWTWRGGAPVRLHLLKQVLLL